ncbi:MAG: hypothetical protein QXL51_06205, partial [Candidatus Aenigmatarchaeota archaeon]
EITFYGYDQSVIEILINNKRLYNKLVIYFARRQNIYFPRKGEPVFVTISGFTKYYFEYRKIREGQKIKFEFGKNNLTIYPENKSLGIIECMNK